MAKLKFAFMNEYYKSHRRPLRDYVFGYFHVAAQLLSFVAPLTNLAMQNSLLKGIAARVMGITHQRPFPKFTRERAKVNRITNPMNPTRQKIIYLPDPFSRYVEPKVEQAAFDILSALGFDVILLPVVSAGTALLSKGFLVEARAHAGRVLNALNKIDPESFLPILGIEPPEIYSLKHDYFDLWPERKEEILKRVKNVWLLEEYLVRSNVLTDLRVAAHKKRSDNLASLKIKFHPHCHQRAEGPADDGSPSGTGATVELLRTCGYEVELIEAGCCGMAGTFGYEAEHYELSMKVGELKLFPAIRKWGEQNRETGNRKPEIVNQVVSSGAACRMQIEQGAGMGAKHPLELVMEALEG
jgi:Fe-S oxidoreductase